MSTTPEQALNACAEQNMQLSKWIPQGMYGASEASAVDQYITDVAHAISSAQTSCSYGTTSCKNEWVSDGCTVKADSVTQTCIMELNSLCIGNVEYVASAGLSAQIAAITDSYIANNEAFDQSAWANSLYQLQYVMVSEVTQTCAAQVLSQNTIGCTNSNLNFTAIDMCAYMDAQINCVLAAPTFPTAYQAAYQALKGNIPVPKGATMTGPDKIEAIILFSLLAVLVLIAIVVATHFGHTNSRGQHTLVGKPGVWLLAIGVALAVALIPGFFLLYAPFVDPFNNGTVASWTVSVDTLTQSAQTNVGILGGIMALIAILTGVGSGLLMTDTVESENWS